MQNATTNPEHADFGKRVIVDGETLGTIHRTLREFFGGTLFEVHLDWMNSSDYYGLPSDTRRFSSNQVQFVDEHQPA